MQNFYAREIQALPFSNHSCGYLPHSSWVLDLLVFVDGFWSVPLPCGGPKIWVQSPFSFHSMKRLRIKSHPVIRSLVSYFSGSHLAPCLYIHGCLNFFWLVSSIYPFFVLSEEHLLRRECWARKIYWLPLQKVWGFWLLHLIGNIFCPFT